MCPLLLYERVGEKPMVEQTVTINITRPIRAELYYYKKKHRLRSYNECISYLLQVKTEAN